jgi:hypothetical protein
MTAIVECVLFLVAFSVPSLNSGECKMVSGSLTYRPTAELNQKVQAYRARIPDMPLEAVQGYPVPVVRKGKLWLGFPFFKRRGVPPEPPELFPPQWVVYIDAQAGDDVEVERRDVPDGSVGQHKLNLTMKEFEEKRNRLWTAVDQLMPLAASNASDVPEQLRPIAADFRRLWTELVQRPLEPYYCELNARWFRLLGISCAHQ